MPEDKDQWERQEKMRAMRREFEAAERAHTASEAVNPVSGTLERLSPDANYPSANQSVSRQSTASLLREHATILRARAAQYNVLADVIEAGANRIQDQAIFGLIISSNLVKT